MLKLNTKYKISKNNKEFYLFLRQYNDEAGKLALEIELSYEYYSNGYKSIDKNYYYAKYKTNMFGTELSINSYSYYNTSVALNSSHQTVDIIIPIKSVGLGSLILNQLILWLKKQYPEVRMKSLSLSPVDENDLENQIRRDKLYRNLGYDIVNKTARGRIAKEMTPRDINFGFSIQQANQ
jgi:hypothetical protein